MALTVYLKIPPSPLCQRGARGDFHASLCPTGMGVYMICLIVFFVSPLWGQEAKKAIEVFPSTPFYQFIIYESLVIFWIAIIGLIVIIWMKLREIERRQKLGLDREEKDRPRWIKGEGK